MAQQTEQITQAIKTFLESINAENLQAVKISFEEKSTEKISPLKTCGWEWDPGLHDLVWVCRP